MSKLALLSISSSRSRIFSKLTISLLLLEFLEVSFSSIESIRSPELFLVYLPIFDFGVFVLVWYAYKAWIPIPVPLFLWIKPNLSSLPSLLSVYEDISVFFYFFGTKSGMLLRVFGLWEASLIRDVEDWIIWRFRFFVVYPVHNLLAFALSY